MQKDLPIRNDREVKYTYELQSVNFDADFSMLHSTKDSSNFSSNHKSYDWKKFEEQFSQFDIHFNPMHKFQESTRRSLQFPQKPPAAPVTLPQKKSKPPKAPSPARSSSSSSSSEQYDPKKSRCGLRVLSMKVKNFVNSRTSTTYREVADEIVESQKAEQQAEKMSEEMRNRELKNVKRRVYDALNVLINAGVIRKQDKKVMPTGESKRMGKSFSENYQVFRRHQKEVEERSEIVGFKEKMLGETLEKYSLHMNLIHRNKTMRQMATVPQTIKDPSRFLCRSSKLSVQSSSPSQSPVLQPQRHSPPPPLPPPLSHPKPKSRRQLPPVPTAPPAPLLRPPILFILLPFTPSEEPSQSVLQIAHKRRLVFQSKQPFKVGSDFEIFKILNVRSLRKPTEFEREVAEFLREVRREGNMDKMVKGISEIVFQDQQAEDEVVKPVKQRRKARLEQQAKKQ